jgi:anthranilate phosphoribosyltransferase
MEHQLLRHYLERFRHGVEMDPADAESLLDSLIGCDNVDLTATLLSAWNDKGTAEDELFALATIMRGRMKRVESQHNKTVEIVGTGGGAAKTFNISTAAAFVVAGTGLAVAKHGNRAATSTSGSFDVLQELGINADIEPSETQESLNEHGLCFMYAPRFHSLSPMLATARRKVGRPTIFNNLGPLCNPASTPHNVIGVWDKRLLQMTARVLARLGSDRSWVVYGEGGLDEIALNGRTHVAEINGNNVAAFEISAADLKVSSPGDTLPVRCSASESASVIRSILANRSKGGDAENLVLINAAAAIYVTGNATSLAESYEMARDSVRCGAAARKLKAMRGQ